MDFKQAEIKSSIIQSLAHPVRLMIVDYLSDGPRRFAEILSLFKYDKSTVSKHLSILKAKGIVSSNRKGVETVYENDISCLPAFLNCIDTVIKDNIEKQECCIINKEK